jgi:gliding motility-associated-like protein
VDGHTTPNSNLWCQTVSVTAGKMYLFRFYIQSVFPTNPPQLIALANNATIGSISGGATCDWLMFEACFTASSGTVQLCIREISLVGFGNDFAIDDIELYEKCQATDEVNVEVVDLKAIIMANKLPKCASDVFDLNAIGSSAGPNIRYEWRSEGGKIVSQNGLTAKGQGSGTYYVKVIYTNGLVICEKEVEMEITTSDDLVAIMDIEGIANCNSDTIILKAITSNGSGNFNYFWIPDNKIHRGQNQSTAYVTEAGIYKVVIIDKNSGCEIDVQNIVVSDTIKPNLSIRGDSLLNCKKNEIFFSGTPFDTSKFLYEWILSDSTKLKNKDTVFTKSSGQYSLKIIDKTNKCSTEKNWNVTIDTIQPKIDLGADAKLDCIQSEINISPIGNNPNVSLQYYWTLPPGIQHTDTILQNKIVSQPGNVILKVINPKNGCEHSDTLSITDDRRFPLLKTGPGIILNCKQSEYRLIVDSIQLDSSRFYWTTTTGRIIRDTFSLNPWIDSPGWYYLHLEDTSNHCKNLDSVFIDQNIITPQSVSGPDLTMRCADTSLVIDGSNSSQGGQLKYYWYSPNGNILSGQNTQKVLVNSSGDYYLIVTDSTNYCADTSVVTVRPDLNVPIASIKLDDTLNCLIKSVTLHGEARSATGNQINFSWTALSGQNIQNANSLNPIVTEAGEYILTVIDQVNGCSATARIRVHMDTIKPIANAGTSSIWNCETNKMILDGSNSNGKHGLIYNWTTLGGSIITDSMRSKIDIGSPGLYILKVIDSQNGCESIDQLEVLKDLIIPMAKINTPDTLNCYKPLITLSGTGSSTGNRYIYEWNTVNGQIIGNANQIDIQIDKPGNYTLTVKDTVNKCTEDDVAIVVEYKNYPLIDAGNPAVLDCKSASIVLSGSIRSPDPTNILWSSGLGNILSRPDSSDIFINRAGLYFLRVTNIRSGCTTTDSVLVTKEFNLVVDAGNAIELTCRIKQATLMGSLFNGEGNEQFNWTTSQGRIVGNNQMIQIMADRPGLYILQVTNPLTGCAGIDSVWLTENTNVPRSIELNLHQPKCPGDGWQVDIKNVNGGEFPLQYFLNNNLFNGITIQGSIYGNHSIKVVDKNGCELVNSFTIITPQGVTVQLPPLIKLTAGDNYQLQPLYSIPDDSIAEVQWSPSDFLSCSNCKYPLIQNITRNTEYLVVYKNKNGCEAMARIRIELLRRDIWIPNVFSPNGDNINDYFYPHVAEDSFNEIRLMTIYDRWGNQLFTKSHFAPNQPTEGWNGISNNQHANPGTYVYYLEVEWKNGEIEKRFGDITLIR